MECLCTRQILKPFKYQFDFLGVILNQDITVLPMGINLEKSSYYSDSNQNLYNAMKIMELMVK